MAMLVGLGVGERQNQQVGTDGLHASRWMQVDTAASWTCHSEELSSTYVDTALRSLLIPTLTAPRLHFPSCPALFSSSVLQERKVCPPLRTIPEKRYSVYRWFYRCLRPHRGPGQDGMFIWLGWLQFLMNDNQSARAVASVISSVSEHLTFSLPFPAHGGSTRFGAATWVIHVDG